jgi:hypothetical protein
MMQHARADDVFEALAEPVDVFDGDLVELEIVEPVVVFEALLEGNALGAEVDPDDARPRPANGVVRRLARAAARDQDRPVVAVWLERPEEMGLDTSTSVIPAPPVGRKIVGRRRIGMTLVKRPNLGGDGVIRAASSPAPSPSRG